MDQGSWLALERRLDTCVGLLIYQVHPGILTPRGFRACVSQLYCLQLFSMFTSIKLSCLPSVVITTWGVMLCFVALYLMRVPFILSLCCVTLDALTLHLESVLHYIICLALRYVSCLALLWMLWLCTFTSMYPSGECTGTTVYYPQVDLDHGTSTFALCDVYCYCPLRTVVRTCVTLIVWILQQNLSLQAKSALFLFTLHGHQLHNAQGFGSAPSFQMMDSCFVTSIEDNINIFFWDYEQSHLPNLPLALLADLGRNVMYSTLHLTVCYTLSELSLLSSRLAKRAKDSNIINYRSNRKLGFRSDR